MAATALTEADAIRLVGPFPAWVDELQKTGKKTLNRNVTQSSRPGEQTNYSILARRGAMQLLGLDEEPKSRSQEMILADVRTEVEGSFDYWSGKINQMKFQIDCTVQMIQDEVEFNFNAVPRLPGAEWPDLSNPSVMQTNILLRSFTYHMNQYIYWLEAKDALDRIDIHSSDVEEAGEEGQGGSTVKQHKMDVDKELEYIRYLANLAAEEAALNVRLMYAGGPLKDFITAILIRPASESEDVLKDIRFSLKRPLEDIGYKSKYSAAACNLFLHPDELGARKTYGPSIETRWLAFEQACNDESKESMRRKYGYALQLVTGEYALPLNLLSSLPSLSTSSESGSSDTPTRTSPLTLRARLNVSQSAIREIINSLPSVGLFFTSNRQRAGEACSALWSAIIAKSTIISSSLGLPKDVLEKFIPCLNDIPYEDTLPKWLPIINGKRAQPKDISIPGGFKPQGAIIMSGNGYITGEELLRTKFVHKQIFRINREDYEMWESMLDYDCEDMGTLEEIAKPFRALGFTVDHIGGSFVRFTPKDNASTPWILRVPHDKTFYEDTYEMPLGSIAGAIPFMYGWDMSWFKVEESDVD